MITTKKRVAERRRLFGHKAEQRRKKIRMIVIGLLSLIIGTSVINQSRNSAILSILDTSETFNNFLASLDDKNERQILEVLNSALINYVNYYGKPDDLTQLTIGLLYGEDDSVMAAASPGEISLNLQEIYTFEDLKGTIQHELAHALVGRNPLDFEAFKMVDGYIYKIHGSSVFVRGNSGEELVFRKIEEGVAEFLAANMDREYRSLSPDYLLYHFLVERLINYRKLGSAQDVYRLHSNSGLVLALAGINSVSSIEEQEQLIDLMRLFNFEEGSSLTTLSFDNVNSELERLWGMYLAKES